MVLRRKLPPDTAAVQVDDPKVHRNHRRMTRIAAALTGAGVVAWAWRSSSSSSTTREQRPPVAPQKIKRVRVHGEEGALELSDHVAGVTSVPYVCVTLDWWPDGKCDWGVCSWARSTVTTLNLRAGASDRRSLERALTALSPAALRVGGTLQDFVTYSEECRTSFFKTDDRAGFQGGCLTRATYDDIDDMAMKAWTPLIFGLAGLHGRHRRSSKGGCPKCEKTPCDPCWTGVWSPQRGGARDLLKHAAMRAVENRSALAAVSLGNELCGIGGIAAHLPPEAIARDYKVLRGELETLFPSAPAIRTLAFPPVQTRPLVVGPDCQLPLENIEGWTSRFLVDGAAAEVLDAFTYHLYWLGSGEKHGRIRRQLVDRQVRASHAPDDKDDDISKPWPPQRSFHARLAAFEHGVAKDGKFLPIWASETGGAYGSGAANVTNVFASAFWYLDELGEMAKRSIAVHCRQALVGGHYALLRRSRGGFDANPDFHATRLWSALMGPRALPASFTKRLRDARTYAHCRLAPRSRPSFGDVVIVVINSASRRALRLTVPPSLRGLHRDEFHVTAPLNAQGIPHVDGRTVLLNGKLYVRSLLCHFSS